MRRVVRVSVKAHCFFSHLRSFPVLLRRGLSPKDPRERGLPVDFTPIVLPKNKKHVQEKKWKDSFTNTSRTTVAERHRCQDG